jgi:chromosome segregation ATPase
LEETRTTIVTRTTSHSDQVTEARENLHGIAEGLADLRERTRQQVDVIDDLISRIETDSIGAVGVLVEELETRITELSNQINSNEAARRRAQEELEAEKDRLTKLWDAYKAQEDELRRARRDEPILREQLADREQLISELEDEIARLRSMEPYKERYQSLLKDHERLRDQNREMEKELQDRNAVIGQLEARTESLKSYEDDSRRVKELERQLNEEKERLAKLYKVYEDTEGKLRESEDEAARWRAWYDRHREAFQVVGDAAQYPVAVQKQ